MRRLGRVLVALGTSVIVAAGTPTTSVGAWTHTVNGIKHGSTGTDTDGDVWAYARVFTGERMTQATVQIGRASDHRVVATVTCISACWRIDVHHHPVTDECAFHVSTHVLERVSRHWQGAC